jgi:hypothetical protein
MKRLVLTLLILSLAVSGAVAKQPCKERADEKKLGAALNSFKCSCDKAAADKKLSGAAKDSFKTKCVKDATGT